jgi:signal transduction histidine kinase
MVETKLKSGGAGLMERLDHAVPDASRRILAVEPALPGDDMAAGSIQQVREEVVRLECVCGFGHISESILHDLRNPLAAIYCAAGMILDADVPLARVKRLASNINSASQRIEQLLRDLRSISRGEIRAAETSSLREIAMAACESLSATAELYGARLAVAIHPEIQLPLQRGRMERALVNLMGNAIEAMAEGGEVRISAELTEGAAVVHVDDTGPGIAPEIRSTLFQPFITSGKRNGLGLGLAFTRQTVLDHGGDVWVDTAPSGGARFSLRLPGARLVPPLIV